MNGCSRPPTMMMPLIAPTISPTAGATSSTPTTPNLVATCGSRNQSASRHPASPTATGSTTPRSGSSAATDRRPATDRPTTPALLNPNRVTAASTTNTVSASAGIPIAAAGVQPGTVSSIAQTTEQSAMIDPTDRSIPAVRITAVIPVAISPVVDTCRSTSSRFP